MKKNFLAGLCLFSLICCSANSQIAPRIMYALVNDTGVLKSTNEGRSWKNDNDGLPKNIVPLELEITGKIQYLTTKNSGLFRRDNPDSDWTAVSSPDFLRRSIYFTDTEYRKISAFAVDKKNPLNIALATKHSIYRSIDGGQNWELLSLAGLDTRNYITALEISGNELYVGTSFNGFYALAGKKFQKMNKGLPQEPYAKGLYFTEELVSIAKHDNTIYAGFRFGKGLYSKSSSAGNWQKLYKIDSGLDTARRITINEGNVYLSIGRRLFKQTDKSSTWQEILMPSSVKIKTTEGVSAIIIADKIGNLPPLYFYQNFDQTPTPKKIETNRKAADKRAIYSNVWSIRKKLDYYITMMQKTGLNAIVIDMKDDFGDIYYPTSIQTAKDIGASKKPLDIPVILEKLHANNIYVIARLVVFKDERLHKGYNGKFAIKNSKTGAPWRGAPGEFWVDPYAKPVQDYNLSVALELEKLGFDEIQFDYIRFPSDGNISQCLYTYRKDPAMYKSEILADFLQRAKQTLSIPVSTDIYGFNSWYSFGNWIGQDMEEFARIVDVISPMVYPSHFGNLFYMNGPRAERSYRIVYDGGQRALAITNNSTYMRPYIQGFKLFSPTWGPEYIKNQAKAALDSKCDGFIFWNAAGDYAMVEKGLSK